MDTSLASLPASVPASSPATLRIPAQHKTTGDDAALQDKAKGVDNKGIDDVELRKAAEHTRDIRRDVPEPPEKPIVTYSRHKATGAFMLSFLDPQTREVLQQIPSERYLDLISSLMATWDKGKGTTDGG